MKKLIAIACVSSAIVACQSSTKNADSTKEAKKKIFTEIFNDKNIENQVYQINPLRDTMLVGEKGTKVRIYANSFTTEKGEPVSGNLTVELKEAFTTTDIVLGNLTTTCKEGFLQSGGMVYINAKSGDKQLKLSENKEIGFFVPTDSVDENMKIYEGQKTDSSISWTSPVDVSNKEVKRLQETFKTVWFYYHKYDGSDITQADKDLSAYDENVLSSWFWDGEERKKGDTIHLSDVYVEVLKYTTDTTTLRESSSGLFIPETVMKKGQNNFISDYNTNYIFTVKKLGWANIDKLFDDPRSKELKLIVSIANEEEFDYVYATMILPKENMYIPGYQRADNNIGFTHLDSEPLILPVGAQVTLLITAYKDDIPYYSVQKTTLKLNQNISCSLEQSKPEDFKKTLAEKI